MPKIVVVTGDRHWSDEVIVRQALSSFPEGTILYEGGATGLDSIARYVGTELKFVVETRKALWKTYGYGAGPIRNREMLQQASSTGEAVRVLAFHNTIEQSKGTKNCVKQALRMGLEVELWSSSGIILLPRL